MARRGPRGSEFFDVSSGSAEIRWDGSRATLYLDGVESSCIDVESPQDLEFEYMQQMTVVLDSWLPQGRPVQALHLGGAACALPWAWETARPGSRQVAVEVDALLAALVREVFDLPRSPALRIRIGEGREPPSGAPARCRCCCRRHHSRSPGGPPATACRAAAGTR